jgi:hypothetical protein
MDDVTPTAQTSLTTVNLNTAGFIRTVVTATLQDVSDSFYTGGEISEDDALRALHRIRGRMRVLEAFLNNLS